MYLSFVQLYCRNVYLIFHAFFFQNACSTKEELSADLVSCRERHQFEIETLEQSLKEKVTTVEELTEERRSFEETVESYKNKMCHLKLEMDESLRNQTETIDKLK
jgi:predicted RNase H-like nuclease (RuvC/YqgF family)